MNTCVRVIGLLPQIVRYLWLAIFTLVTFSVLFLSSLIAYSFPWPPLKEHSFLVFILTVACVTVYAFLILLAHKLRLFKRIDDANAFRWVILILSVLVFCLQC